MEREFELIVRALIIKDGKILVCKTHNRDYYFLPGGHIEYGENMRDALSREINEEMGATVTDAKYIGGVENIFTQDDKKRHEVSFVFETTIDQQEISSQESHVEFFWLSLDEFVGEDIVPSALKDAVTKWKSDGEQFFIEARIDGSE